MNPYAAPTTQIACRGRGSPLLFSCVWVAFTIALVPAVGWLAGCIVWTSGFTRIDNETLAGWATIAAMLTGLLALVGSLALLAVVLLRRPSQRPDSN